MAKKSATVDFLNSYVYGKQNAVLTNSDYWQRFYQAVLTRTRGQNTLVSFGLTIQQ